MGINYKRVKIINSDPRSLSQSFFSLISKITFFLYSYFCIFFTEGHLELVKYLLEARADVNAQTGTGDTALSFACERGKYHNCAMFVHLLNIGTENNFSPCLVHTDVADLFLIVFVKN